MSGAVAYPAAGMPPLSTPSGSAPSSSSSATIAGRPIRTAKWSGCWLFSLRLMRRLRADGSAATIRRTSSARFIAIAEKMWCRAPRLTRNSATARCAASSHPSQHVAQPITSSSWSSPCPTTSPPASARRRTTSRLTGGCGPVHRVGVVALLASVYVEPALQQQVHRRQVSLFGRRVQQRPLVRLRASVQLVWVFVEQGGQC